MILTEIVCNVFQIKNGRQADFTSSLSTVYSDSKMGSFFIGFFSQAENDAQKDLHPKNRINL